MSESLCNKCQKFYGNPKNLNMCSVCYKYFSPHSDSTSKKKGSRTRSKTSKFPKSQNNHPQDSRIILDVSFAKRKSDC